MGVSARDLNDRVRFMFKPLFSNSYEPVNQGRLRLLNWASPLTILFGLWSSVAVGNTIGADSQNFNPAASPMDHVTVYTSKTLGQGNYSLGLFADGAVNTLPYFSETGAPSNDSRKSHNDMVVGANVVGSFGIMNNWDLFLSLPYVVYQEVSDESYHGQYADTGNTAVIAGTKVRLWGNETTGIALVASVVMNRMKDNPYAGEGSGATFNTELAVDHQIGIVSLAANAGYRTRQSGDDVVDNSSNTTPVTPYSNQVLLSGAVGVMVPGTPGEIVGEVYGNQASEDISRQSERRASVAEFILGYKHRLNEAYTLHFGAGGEFKHSTASADRRFYTGITWMEKNEKPKVVTPSKPIPAPQPAVSPIPSKRPDQTIVIKDILFKFDSDEISHSAAQKNLKSLVDILNGPRGLNKLVIEGHTCAIGADAYNKKLSQRRADAIKKWLVENHKISAEKIVSIGHGEEHAIGDNKTADGRKLNRRVEFKIYHATKAPVAQNKK